MTVVSPWEMLSCICVSYQESIGGEGGGAEELKNGQRDHVEIIVEKH